MMIRTIKRWGPVFHLALLLGWPGIAFAQLCSPNDINLFTQADVDNFQSNHGPCSTVSGFLIVNSSPPDSITNLDGLLGLFEINGLLILGNNLLSDLGGLSNLASINGLSIQGNNSLSGLGAFANITSLPQSLILIDNPSLSGLAGLSGVQEIGNFAIAGMNGLASLNDLSSLMTVSGDITINNNPALTDISELTGITGFQSLELRLNPLLASLDGLQGANSLTSLIVEENDSITNLDALAGLTSVGNMEPDLQIIGNDNLADLDGLGSLVSLDANLFINNNPMLGDCSGLSTLLDDVDDADPGPGPGGAGIPDINGNVTISFNQTNCNSSSEILSGPALGPIGLTPAGPVTQGIVLDIEGEASDIGRGDSDVINVEYSVDAGPWSGATPVDGAFDSPTESYSASLITGSLSFGLHQVCVRAEDALGHLGQRCVQIEVVEGVMDGEWMVVCDLNPAWPQPNETVEVELTVLARPEGNESADPFGVDRVEIWFDDTSGPVSVLEGSGVTSDVFLSAQLDAGIHNYGCRAKLGDLAIFSGWRSFSVGAPAGNGRIPIGVTGPSSQRLDIVFIADEDSYSGPEDAGFIDDVGTVMRESYFEYGYYNRYQHMFNFWISRQTAQVDGDNTNCNPPGTNTEKVVNLPSDWEDQYGFAETGAVIHTDCFREYARNGIFTIEPGERANTPSHELGHRAFGLSDEYCCDSTYYERDVFPNVYETLEACEDDAPNLGKTAEDCRDWDAEDENGMYEATWYTSDPTNDLMGGAQTPPQAADKRRIDWFFDKCGDDEC